MMPKEILGQALPPPISKDTGLGTSPLDPGHLLKAIFHILWIILDIIRDDFIDASDAPVPFERGLSAIEDLA